MRPILLRSGIYVGAWLALTVVCWWRIPLTAQGVLWAEDGNVFLTDAMAEGERFAPFRPYAGYLHFIPRVASEFVVDFVTIDNYAIVMNLLACGALAGISLLTFHCSASVSPGVWIRGAWAAIPVLVNVGAIETLGSFANLHWYLLWLTPWLLVKPAKTWVEGALLFTVAAASSMTEIIAVVFVPLFLYRWRNRGLWPARAGLAIGLIAQIYTTITFPRPDISSNYTMDPMSILYGWFLNTAGPIVYGESRPLMHQIINFAAAPVVLAAIIVAIGVTVVLVYGQRKDRRLVLLFVAASFFVWTACAVANPVKFLDYARFTENDWFDFFWFTRYSVAPTMFMLAIVPVLASVLKRWVSWAEAAVLVGFGLLLTSMYFPSSTQRVGGPVWADDVSVGRTLCGPASDTDYFAIPVAPAYYNGVVKVRCPLLLK